MDSKELQHHGIKGQKWGVRRYQNEDGSLTKAGMARYKDEVNSYFKTFHGAKIRLKKDKFSIICPFYT